MGCGVVLCKYQIIFRNQFLLVDIKSPKQFILNWELLARLFFFGIANCFQKKNPHNYEL